MNLPVNSFTTRFLFGPGAVGGLGAGSWTIVVACVALLGWKAFALWTINVNWDEFYFLTHVHALLRGDLEIPFQTVYTQAFRWLPWVGAGEMAQILAARICMFLLLALSVWQIIRLASRWTTSGAALTAALAFLCLLPTQMHGASFRADSLLLPILLGTLLLLTRPVGSQRADVAAGVLCGIGMAVSVKMALFAPLFLACVLLAGDSIVPTSARLRVALLRCVLIGAICLALAAALVNLHQLTLKAPDVESAATFADRSLGKTILDARFLPGKFYLYHLIREDRFVWIVMGVGLLLALARRRWLPAAMVLAVSPVLFYRNSFPYFYVVMLAPAAILVALVVERVRELARRDATASAREWVPAACGLLLLVHGGSRLPRMSADEQLVQRQVLKVVHQIFPRPVAYIDHAGLVSTFHKVNFFMSTWGMDEYRRRGKPFMPSALHDYRPPLLINPGYLDVASPASKYLLPEDRDALERFYHPYWGPVYIAGARAVLTAGEVQTVALPFPGKYRVESAEAVIIDGVLRSPGELFDVAGNSAELARNGAVSGALQVQLLTAEAGLPPAEKPHSGNIFTGL